jgi:hypothetical protein
MKNRLFLSLFALFISCLMLFSCSGVSYRDTATAVDEGYAPRNYKKTVPEGYADAVSDGDTRAEDEESDEGTEDSAEESTEAEPAARMVIYRGHMQIQVVHPGDTLQRLTSLAKAQGGFIERTNYEDQGRRVVVILRVPVAKFFDMMDALPELGTVLSRAIQANDVTAEFADVENRLKSARILKERLERLLNTVKNVEEKVKILREINRLATEIETLSARSKELSDRASMSTIVVQLSAEPRSTSSPELRSPFPVVRNLNPAQRSIEDRSSIKAQKPDGFFDNTDDFKDGAAHQFYSPDGTVLRSGEVENRPLGDAAFWKKAMQIEFQRRSYKEMQSVALTNGHLFVYRIHDGLNIYYYGVAFRITDKKIQIFEAFSPREDAYKKDGAKMTEFLKSIGGQP